MSNSLKKTDQIKKKKLIIPFGKGLFSVATVIVLSACFSNNADDGDDAQNENPNAGNSDNNDAEMVMDGQALPDSVEMSVGEIDVLTGLDGMGYQNGNPDDTKFNHPAGIVPFDDGFLITDSGNHTLRYVSMSGQSETFAGRYDGYDEYGEPEGRFDHGTGEEAGFDTPLGLVYDEDSGLLYVADAGNGAIRRVTEDGEVSTVAEDLDYPTDLILLDGSLIVSEARAHVLTLVDPESGETEHLAGGGYEEADGELVGRFADGSGEGAGFNEPFGLAVLEETIVVADSGNQRIRQVTLDGEVTTLAGSGDNLIPGADYITPGSDDGPVSEAGFHFPRGVAVLSSGAILVADTYNHRLRLITEDEVLPVAGHGVHGMVNGPVEDALFDGPYHVAVFGERILVTDHWNHMIREVELVE
ncbi:NHL repeat-containing protein [Salisediminibacterium selenitireducens]|uniref:NHL repeat containing protein n=1 Tax=Bacillus selenitireducens (strain ATCC 700615 / DSM 15326 / MLS10) TaxID=439292 RepID=D6XYN7_BACIE|nr:NHL repeat containing protein [Salisediminibacterium selenitireducens]ADH98195.1 NHL repeat containing protein [[Bacillus] selenitireducens MLS10]